MVVFALHLPVIIQSQQFGTFANVASSIPFLLVGLAGLHFRRLAQNLPLLVFAFSLFLVAGGSIFYHWSPSAYRLLWDRVPIAICLSAFTCAVINAHLNARLGTILLPPALVLSLAAVLYWYATFIGGAEDLRPWAVVQIGTMLLGGFVAFSRRPELQGIGKLRLALVAFVAGRICELFQDRISSALGIQIGHPLKHLLLALAAFFIIQALASTTDEEAETRGLTMEPASLD